MRRLLIIAIPTLILTLLLAFDFKTYRSLQSMHNKISVLQRQVDEAAKVAREESAVASAASLRANDAALHAQTAAAARQEAEREKQHAVEGRDDAVMAEAHASAQAREAQAQVTLMRSEREEELNRMQQALNRVVETRRTATGMVIVLPEAIFRFEFDKADLNSRNRELLSRIAGVLLVSKGYGLSIFGYTDDVGTAEYNRQLSLHRARAVQDYLVQSGIEASIINVKGYGKSSPSSSGTTAADRARNRRVEIAVTESSIRYGG